MEIKKSKIGIFLLFSLVFMSMIGGVFGAADCNGKDKGTIQCLATSENLVDFFRNMAWMNWVIYIALIFIVANVFIQVLGDHNGAKMGAYLVSFMGITGFMWVLIDNKIFPIHIMLWIAEIFVLVFAGAIIKLSFGLSKDSNGIMGKLKWFGLFFAVLIVNQFNGMLMSFWDPMSTSSGFIQIQTDSTLYTIAKTLHFVNIPIAIILPLLIGWVIVSLFGEMGVTRKVKQGPLRKFLKGIANEVKIETKRDKLIQEIGDLYKTLRGNI